MDNYEKFGKKTTFIKLCFCFLNPGHEQGKLCPGVGIFVCFFDAGARVLH